MTNCASKIFLALTLCAVAGHAQESGSVPGNVAPAPPAIGSSDAATLVLAPAPRDNTPPSHVDSDGVTRSVSPGIAAALAEGMPKFHPPTPTPTPTPENAEAADTDRPKNEIKRLPTYLVQETRPPVFRNRDLFTTEGLTALSFKAHGGLIFGNILGLNSGAAYNMYLDDQRTTDMDDLSDLSHVMSRGGDSSESSYILKESNDTYMRGGSSGWDWSGGGIVGGNNTGGSGK